MKKLVALVCAACLAAVFLLTAAACTQPSPQELWQTAMQKLEQGAYITADYAMTMTQKNDLGRIEREEDAFSVQLAHNAQGDLYADLGNGGPLWVVDGTRFIPEQFGGNILYVPQEVGSAEAAIAGAASGLFGAEEGILQKLGWEELSGVREKVASENGGHRYTLEVDLTAMLEAVFEKLDELSGMRISRYKTFVYKLLDPAITLADFYALLEEKLSEFGLSLQLFCTDSFWTGLLREQGLLPGSTGGRSAAALCYIALSQAYAQNETLKLHVDPPKEGESCTDYLLRVMGSERATALFSAFNWNAEFLFADLKNEFDALNQRNVSLEYVLDTIWMRETGMPLGIRETLEEIDLRRGTVKLETVFDADGRFEELAVSLDMAMMLTDEHGRSGIVQTQAEMSIGFSYQPFTLQVLPEEQMFPRVSAPRADEGGRVFLPISWNCGFPNEFSVAASSFCTLIIYDADGNILGSDSVYYPDAVVWTREKGGYSADFSAYAAGLIAAADIDASVAAAADSYKAALRVECNWFSGYYFDMIDTQEILFTIAKDGTLLSIY